MAIFEKTIKYTEDQKNKMVKITILNDESLHMTSMRMLGDRILLPIGKIIEKDVGICKDLNGKKLIVSTTVGVTRNIDRAKLVYEFKIGDESKTFTNPVTLQGNLPEFKSEFKFVQSRQS